MKKGKLIVVFIVLLCLVGGVYFSNKSEIDKLSKQILQLATVTKVDKAQWVENVSPGMNHFFGDAFGSFDYPTDWGQPMPTTTSFNGGIWAGGKSSLHFSPGGFSAYPYMEGYYHHPEANIYYPFEVEMPGVDVDLAAAANFTKGTTAKKACEAYKKLHKFKAECQQFLNNTFFLDNTDEGSIWFVEYPFRYDAIQYSRWDYYPGFVIHNINGGSDFEKTNEEVKNLIKSLKVPGAPGSGVDDESKINFIEEG